MRLTERDIKLVRDVALSHVMSRDQLIQLGYFGTVTRVNTRLRGLIELGLIRRLDTPFFSQSLYAVGRKARTVTGGQIASLLAGRRESPRFIQHALCVNNVRIAFREKGVTTWRFEQQAHHAFKFAGRDFEVRPDGIAISSAGLRVIEVDLGHVAPAKFAAKLKAYEAFLVSGECAKAWGAPSFKLLILTLGDLRAKGLSRLLTKHPQLSAACGTFEHIGVSTVGGWS